MREMAPPGRGCVVWTFGLVSVPSYPRHLSRHLSRSLSHAPATHVNGRAAGLRPPPLFSTITPTLNFHAIRSAVRLPRASQPCSCPWAGTPSDRARCLTASRLSARGHGRAEVATVFSAAATERRESREARTHSSSPLTPTTLAWVPGLPPLPAVVIRRILRRRILEDAVMQRAHQKPVDPAQVLNR